MKPSEVILNCVNGVGPSHGMDSFLTQYEDHKIYGEVVKGIYEITMNYTNENFPIGYMNPDSFKELIEYSKYLEKIEM
jgi:hypothetical protein